VGHWLLLASIVGIGLGVLMGSSDLGQRMVGDRQFIGPSFVAIIPLGMILWDRVWL
jgi:ABC-type nitrate/sulfonate/bicarbonate transport system permease component